MCALKNYTQLHPATVFQVWPVYFRPDVDTVSISLDVVHCYFVDVWDREYYSQDTPQDTRYDCSLFKTMSKINHLEVLIHEPDVEDVRDYFLGGWYPEGDEDNKCPQRPYYGKETSRPLGVKMNTGSSRSRCPRCLRKLENIKYGMEQEVVLFYTGAYEGDESETDEELVASRDGEIREPRKIIFD
jgi:hypothetical protein